MVVLTAVSTVGDLEFSTLVQYARDQLQDKNDEKATRRAKRCVNRALRYVSAEKEWTWQRILHRIIMRPDVDITAATMEAEGIALPHATAKPKQPSHDAGHPEANIGSK